MIETLARHFGAAWGDGEDPPDAYLNFEGRKIAVEITALAQLVKDDQGKLISRQSQDAGALQMADSLNSDLGNIFPHTRAAFLTFFAPIKNFRRLRTQLERELKRVAALAEGPLEPLERVVEDDSVIINVHEEWEPGSKRVAAAVVNKRSSSDILANATDTLTDSIRRKSGWSKAIAPQQAWLALLNTYDLLASGDTYRQALRSIKVDHQFSSILVISTSGKIDMLYQCS